MGDLGLSQSRREVEREWSLWRREGWEVTHPRAQGNGSGPCKKAQSSRILWGSAWSGGESEGRRCRPTWEVSARAAEAGLGAAIPPAVSPRPSTALLQAARRSVSRASLQLALPRAKAVAPRGGFRKGCGGGGREWGDPDSQPGPSFPPPQPPRSHRSGLIAGAYPGCSGCPPSLGSKSSLSGSLQRAGFLGVWVHRTGGREKMLVSSPAPCLSLRMAWDGQSGHFFSE